jgi:hypothetical protein
MTVEDWAVLPRQNRASFRAAPTGIDGLQDRSSRPRTQPAHAAASIERRAVPLRRRHRWGAADNRPRARPRRLDGTVKPDVEPRSIAG